MTQGTVTDEYMIEMRAKAKPYTLILLKRGPAWDTTPDRDSIIWEHGRRNHTLRLQKILSIVCPVPDDSPLHGIGIFEKSPEEVEEIMRGDPGVQAGIFVYETHPTWGFPGDSLP